MCILDISKKCLQNFTTNTCCRSFIKNVKLYIPTWTALFITSSDDVCVVTKHDINRFDTSDYAIDNAYDIPLVNKKVPDLMKDEINDAIMTEFAGLRAKMYALCVDGKKNTKKVKMSRTTQRDSNVQ